MFLCSQITKYAGMFCDHVTMYFVYLLMSIIYGLQLSKQSPYFKNNTNTWYLNERVFVQLRVKTNTRNNPYVKRFFVKCTKMEPTW